MAVEIIGFPGVTVHYKNGVTHCSNHILVLIYDSCVLHAYPTFILFNCYEAYGMVSCAIMFTKDTQIRKYYSKAFL